MTDQPKKHNKPHPNCKCPDCNRDADGNLPKIKYTKLHIEDIICAYGFLFGAMVLGVDKMVLLDWNEIYGVAAIGKNQTILVRTEYLEGLDQFDDEEINREGCCEYRDEYE